MKLLTTFLLLLFSFFFISTPIIYAQSPPPSSVNFDPDEIINQLNTNSQCGKIGQACCTKIDLPVIIFSPPEIFPGVDFILSNIADFVNGIATKLKGAYQFVANIFSDTVSQILCTEKGSYPSDKKNLANCNCLPKKTKDIASLCLNIGSAAEKTKCITCSKKGLWTALGCIDFKLQDFIKDILFGIGISLAGVISLLCIIYSAFILQTSSGNPERIKRAQEMLTSCIMGLTLIIFSIFILRVIGVDILKIPGFS